MKYNVVQMNLIFHMGREFMYWHWYEKHEFHNFLKTFRTSPCWLFTPVLTWIWLTMTIHPEYGFMANTKSKRLELPRFVSTFGVTNFQAERYQNFGSWLYTRYSVIHAQWCSLHNLKIYFASFSAINGLRSLWGPRGFLAWVTTMIFDLQVEPFQTLQH